jgi:hypothetical protein
MISLQNLKYLAPHANTDDNATHEYINIEMINEYTPENTKPQALIFNQVKTADIVSVTSDYYLSVVRWNIQSNLPVLIPDMVIQNPPLPNFSADTQYQLILLYTTAGTSVYNGAIFHNPAPQQSYTVKFTPEIVDLQTIDYVSSPKNKNEIYSNPLYYIKSVDTFLKMLNTAIQTNLNDIAGATWVHLPYFEWDSTAQKIVFNRPNSIPSGVTGGDQFTQWYLSVNQPLYNLLNTFRFYNMPSGTVMDTKYPPLTPCRYLLDTSILPPYSDTSLGEYTPYLQQTSSVVNWSPVQSIVFTSGTIPVEPQLSGAPTNLNIVNPSTQATTYQQQGITKVLTDFCIPFNSGVEATNQQIYYLPTAEYRLIDLLGNNNLNELTIQVEWRDKFGVLHPMTLDAGASANVLILLRKKLYNNQKTN